MMETEPNCQANIHLASIFFIQYIYILYFRIKTKAHIYTKILLRNHHTYIYIYYLIFITIKHKFFFSHDLTIAIQSACPCWRPSRRLARWRRPWRTTLRGSEKSVERAGQKSLRPTFFKGSFGLGICFRPPFFLMIFVWNIWGFWEFWWFVNFVKDAEWWRCHPYFLTSFISLFQETNKYKPSHEVYHLIVEIWWSNMMILFSTKPQMLKVKVSLWILPFGVIVFKSYPLGMIIGYFLKCNVNISITQFWRLVASKLSSKLLTPSCTRPLLADANIKIVEAVSKARFLTVTRVCWAQCFLPKFFVLWFQHF